MSQLAWILRLFLSKSISVEGLKVGKQEKKDIKYAVRLYLREELEARISFFKAKDIFPRGFGFFKFLAFSLGKKSHKFPSADFQVNFVNSRDLCTLNRFEDNPLIRDAWVMF